MRTFIALELPSDFITNIAQIEQDLQSSIQGHFVTENSLHLSLALAKNIRTELTIKGLPYDQVQFKPHITLARHAHLTLQQIKDYPMPDTTRATNVTIFRSDLLPNGAQYTPLHSVTL